MGRKRSKNRLKRRVIRYETKGIPQGRPPKAKNNPFDSPWFWLSLATIDFCKAFGIGAGNTEEQTPNKEGS
jgi:hypothetical protein